MGTKCVEIPVLDLRKVPHDRIPDLVKSLRSKHSEIEFPFLDDDLKGALISHIQGDVFEDAKRPKLTIQITKEEQEFVELTDALEVAFSTLDSSKTAESIRNARERWEECLRKTNGDLDKACELYDQL